MDDGFMAPEDESLIVFDARPRDKRELFSAMLGRLASAGLVKDPGTALRAVMEREATKPTGLSRGVACPHAKTDEVKALAVAVARLAEPLDFGAEDGVPARHVFLILSPKDATGNPHIKALASIVRCYRDTAAVARLDAAETPAAYLAILEGGHGR